LSTVAVPKRIRGKLSEIILLRGSMKIITSEKELRKVGGTTVTHLF